MVYAESKLANVLHTRELAARLEATDVVVHCLHPGNVATRFGRDGDLHGANDRLLWFAQYVLISPERGAQTPVHLASSPDALRTSGDYWVRRRRHRPARRGPRRRRGAATPPAQRHPGRRLALSRPAPPPGCDGQANEAMTSSPNHWTESSW